jgi:hypothetical protein
MATKKSPARKLNKSAFVREQPADMPAKEVVKAAKAAGIELSEGFVYNIRSAAKKKARVAPTRAGGAKAAPAGDEAAFRGLVVSLGTGRARALIDEVEAGLARVVAG